MDSWNESCLPLSQEINLWDGKTTLGKLLENPNQPVRSVNKDGVIVPNRIKQIWKVGTKETFKITDELGNSVTLTDNHRVLTSDGWKEVKDLFIGDNIAHNGIFPYQDKEWLVQQAEKGLSVKDIAALADVTTRTIHDWFKRLDLGTPSSYHSKLWKDKEFLQEHYVERGLSQKDCAELAGCTEHTIRKYVRIYGLQQDQIERMHAHNRKNGVFGKGQTALVNDVIALRGKKSGEALRGRDVPSGKFHHSYVGENATDRSTYHDRARKLADYSRGCHICGKNDESLEVHHRDGDFTNNNEDNLIVVCKNHHRILHGQAPKIYSFSKIVSIESMGEEDVYDVEMELEENFVAGNIVVHNSRRYITEQPTFYIPKPNQWRSSPENKKQGSGPILEVNEATVELTERLIQRVDQSVKDYEWAMEQGVAPEQARVFLLAYDMYVRWRWTASLQSGMHFLKQRLAHDAQAEIAEYASAVFTLLSNEFPNALLQLEKDMEQGKI